MNSEKNDAFAGRIVVINGATGTIGEAMAFALQRQGAQLILFGRKSDRLNHLADELTAELGAEAEHRAPVIQTVDFSGAAIEDYQTLTDAIENNFGRIDILIHAMGQGGQLSPLAHSDLMKFQESLHLNLIAPFALTRSLWHLLERPGKQVEANRAQVLFFTDRGTPAFGNAYTLAHAAIERMIDQWANETTSVRINGLDPGPTHSGLRQYRFPGEARSERADVSVLLPTALALLANEQAHGQLIRLQPDRI
ncbi:SDR family NAD(P)-dependent oxidoreductase [Halothiobacillus neapolitanus]|uniref:Short-chain dehydrogenase/reductase SDR n=1 Tax=Halothiobacillus neapolitanus (strain ATCC 23641 / DSM 15147 / CIP 104769 / NCIMB 8539 / c2) TaxID=555778 RepID=D0L106_HALNC|nr:SDR family NAD(P)-dependent oxidoreductase [Halothiobacillus neapolitanus]ACX96379.1 short-chain dehydrogenase/reductase SDR [Halothiobacillus neapolitanus c2]TDN66694.1 NAD(P)-dependent dehydrogenase (short-subunit alcohol dehydrogenase family) [Halothiobacillus neapolitanus]